MDQTGAPEGPHNSTPALERLPVGRAGSVVGAVQSTRPEAASSAATAPWLVQQAYLGSPARPTSLAEMGTITRPAA